MRWQSIETAPRDATRVLLTEGKSVSVGFFCTDYRQWMTDCGYVYGLVEPASHWQPLPEPPK
jgi:hypothetical protein